MDVQMKQDRQHWQDWINLLVGLWILISPLTFMDVSVAVAWNLVVVGGAVVAVAIAALARFRPWEEWTNLVLGAWLFASPWIFGFYQDTRMLWNAVICGVLVILFSAITLPEAQRQSYGH